MQALEYLLAWLGLVEWLGVTAVVIHSQLRAQHRARVEVSGHMTDVSRIPWLAALLLVPYAVVVVLLWRPVLTELPSAIGPVASGVGFAVLTAGAAFILWGRFTLGRSHNISSVAGVELFADHHLVTSGPYGLVRHPMYLGFAIAIVGALLLYRTWTIVFIALHGFVFVVRARREEAALARVFGEEWRAYASHVPAFVPRLRRLVDFRHLEPSIFGQRVEPAGLGGGRRDEGVPTGSQRVFSVSPVSREERGDGNDSD